MFTKNCNLYAHLRNIHGSDSSDYLPVNNFKCTACQKIFKIQRTLNSHIKNIMKMVMKTKIQE